MSGLTLINEMNDLQMQLRDGVRLMSDYGRKFAQAEHDYKVALMQEALRLRDDGLPVTIIDKVVYGKVADKRLKRDIAEVMYKTSQENIHAVKLRLRLVDAQIQREWVNNE